MHNGASFFVFICCLHQVVLCANSRPVLNDVTYNELSILTKRVASVCEDINNALINGRLLVMESGQGSPCLDLRYCILLTSARFSQVFLGAISVRGGNVESRRTAPFISGLVLSMLATRKICVTPAALDVIKHVFMNWMRGSSNGRCGNRVALV